jgi:hypothetical protein
MIKPQALLPLILLLAMLSSSPMIAKSTQSQEPLQIEEQWLVTWGGDDYESPRRIIHDGSHLYIYGRTLSYGNRESNVFLAKYDKEGGLVWNVTWETPAGDIPRGYAIEGDAIYITGTTYRETEPLNLDVFLLKFDKSSGELLWNASWGGIGWEGAQSSDFGKDVEALNGGIYVAGTTTNDASSRKEQDVLLLKFDTEGEQIWQRQYGADPTYEYGYHLETSGGELYIAGRYLSITRPPNATEPIREETMLLLKLDTEGEMLWNVTYTGIQNQPTGILVAGDSIYMVGNAWITDRKGEVSVMRVGLDGALDWYKLWGSEENENAHYGLGVTEDSVYAFGSIGGYGFRNHDLNLLRYSLDGELLGNLTWGSWRNESAWDMTLIGDTFYLLGQVSTSEEGVDVSLSAMVNPFPPYVGPGLKEPLLQSWQIYGIVGVLLALAGYLYLWRIVGD